MDEIADQYPDLEERKAKMKRTVLEYYLNRIPFGHGYYGVRSGRWGTLARNPWRSALKSARPWWPA